MNPNDPMSQFKERYQQYVETKAPSSPPVIHNSGKGFFNKFYVQGLIVGIVIIASSVLIYLNFKPDSKTASTQQNPVAVIPTPTRTPMIISEDQIDSELMRTWGQYYPQMKDDSKQREAAKNRLIKRAIIFGGISQNKIEMSSIASDNPTQQEMKAEESLSLKVLSWRNIDYAYVYIDATNPKYKNYPEQAMYSYNLIKSNLSKGSSFKEAFDSAVKDPKFFKPITAYYGKLFFKNDWGNEVSKVLFKYKKGESTEIIAPPGGVYVLAYINDSNDTPYATIDEWIASQK